MVKRSSAVVSVIILLILGLMPSTMLGADAAGRFDDVPDDHLFAEDIEWLAGEGITLGCNPPDNTLFCPDDNVTRGQMAAFLVRGLDLTEGGPSFDDTTGHIFEQDISKLARAGITLGCNPPDNTEFCPDDNVTRAQMAAFLHRGLDEQPPPTSTTTSTSTTATTSTTSSTTSTSSTTTTTTPTDPNEVTWTCAESGTSWSCEGNIDRSDPAIETWTCPANWDCSGNVNKSDTATETWSCSEQFGDTFCEGNVDKAGIDNEMWLCGIFQGAWDCNGNVEDGAPPTDWICNDDGGAWDCEGEIDTAHSGTETWECELDGTWVCEGDVGFRAAMVSPTPYTFFGAMP